MRPARKKTLKKLLLPATTTLLTGVGLQWYDKSMPASRLVTAEVNPLDFDDHGLKIIPTFADHRSRTLSILYGGAG